MLADGNPSKPSLKTRLWGLSVKMLLGSNPGLYSYQRCLPRLSVPPLKLTIKRLLDNLAVTSSTEEMSEFRDQARHFLQTIGNKLQFILVLKSWWSSYYSFEWREELLFLSNRKPLATHTNYYILDHKDYTPTDCQIPRAATLVYYFLEAWRKIEREQLPPLLVKDTIPVCMDQYRRLFSTVRLPGEKIDKLVHFDPRESRHIVVWCKGLHYKLDIVDDFNQLLTPHHIQEQLYEIERDAAKHNETVSDSEKSVPSLTGLPRDRWAKIMKKHFCEGLNGRSLDVINKAILMVALFEKVPKDMSDKARNIMHSDGKTLWFDKSVTLCIFPDGQCGLNGEHSMADSLPFGHIWEYLFTNEGLQMSYIERGDVMPPPAEFRQGRHNPPSRIEWNITDSLASCISEAVAFGMKNISDMDLHIENQDIIGKEKLVKALISPDAFIQLAIQLAFYREYKRYVLLMLQCMKLSYLMYYKSFGILIFSIYRVCLCIFQSSINSFNIKITVKKVFFVNHLNIVIMSIHPSNLNS